MYGAYPQAHTYKLAALHSSVTLETFDCVVLSLCSGHVTCFQEFVSHTSQVLLKFRSSVWSGTN